MSTKLSAVIIASIGLSTSIAGADIVEFQDPGIISPIANAQAEVIWVGSSAGYTGELSWINPNSAITSSELWTNKFAYAGQRALLPNIYGLGERVDFSYEIIAGRYDVFSTNNERDWPQFVTDASDPFDVRVGIEDIGYPSGDMDHNGAVFRVIFSQATVPAPGAFVILGGGCLMMARRRR